MNANKRSDLRRRAEQKKAARRKQRIEARKKAERVRVEVRKELARPREWTVDLVRALETGNATNAAPALAHHIRWAEIAMGQARALGSADQLLRLAEHLVRAEPRLLHADCWESLRLVAAAPWLRPLTTLRLRGRSVHRRFTSLVDHLLVRYPLPRFFYVAFGPIAGPSQAFRHRDELVEHHRFKAVRLFAHVARGGSLFELAGSELLPAPLTRRMCHDLLRLSGSMTVNEAARRIQVRAAGGSRALEEEICSSLLVYFHRDEAFTAELIDWLARKMPDSCLRHLRPLTRYIEQRRAADHTFTLKRRAFDPLLADMLDRQRQARADASLRARLWSSCGIPAGSWTERCDIGNGVVAPIPWTLTEILDAKDLAAEGRAMKHCVFWHYGPRVAEETDSIFSLRRADERRVTVRVNRKHRRIDEARGKLNRDLTPIERKLLARWCREQDLRVAQQVL